MSISSSRIESFVENITNFETLILEDQILVFGYYLQEKEKLPNFNHNAIESCFKITDLIIPKNINSRLRKLEEKKLLVKNNGGFRVERKKFKSIETDILGKPKLQTLSSELENLPKLLKDPEKKYVSEVIGCLRIEAYHAAIILMWALTISHLRNYVIANKLSEFNHELSIHTKFSKKKFTITKYDDFEDMSDFDFLDILRKSKVSSKNQHKLLNEKLGIRNIYAHPTNLTLKDSKTISFIEELINDIITKIQ